MRAVEIEYQVVLLGGEVLILPLREYSASSIQSLLPDTVRLNKTWVILLPSGSKCVVYRNIPLQLVIGSIGELVYGEICMQVWPEGWRIRLALQSTTVFSRDYFRTQGLHLENLDCDVDCSYRYER